MDRILLVEPAYKNKYPPLGLMKISTFHKEYKNDYVKFIKGIYSKEELPGKWDRIYITTLFTFDYNEVIKTINHYKKFVNNPENNIIIGGILASLLPDRIFDATGITPFIGQITCASQIGYSDHTGENIDVMPLDYDILSEIDYEYPAGDNYFGYTSRGCPNKCSFCAVPKLEPEFQTTNNILSQIKNINEKYGEKRNLLLMDNNILNSDNLSGIVEDIKKCGFDKDKPTFIKPAEFLNIYKRIKRRQELSKEMYKEEIERDSFKMINSLSEFKNKVRVNFLSLYEEIMENINSKDTIEEKMIFIEKVYDDLLKIEINAKNRSKLFRYVDFNQGTEAKLLSEEKMKLLAQIPVKPYRIAFDHLSYEKYYKDAMILASKYGVKNFSNYLLFNYKDKPEDLWERLKINIDLAEEIKAADLFSFPMKYAPINQTDRKFVGDHWNKKYIKNIYAILNSKKGIVPKKREYFEAAFGKTKEEFMELLMLPKDFIVYRDFFSKIGFSDKWKELFRKLDKNEKKNLLDYQCGNEIETSNKILKKMFLMENINKRKVEILIEEIWNDNSKINNEKLFKMILEIGEKNISKTLDIKKYIQTNKK
ncbi:hypothetical protein [uncultured Ilyobacter sp.]|uniref:hypothetical protein n=1 Tax=uncultured Ilyobacter sp. TaxID=544433 RepID=UPI0029C02E03|nr:hypothetical protein [uncultured Ilyobacter sp.]